MSLNFLGALPLDCKMWHPFPIMQDLVHDPCRLTNAPGCTSVVADCHASSQGPEAPRHCQTTCYTVGCPLAVASCGTPWFWEPEQLTPYRLCMCSLQWRSSRLMPGLGQRWPGLWWDHTQGESIEEAHILKGREIWLVLINWSNSRVDAGKKKQLILIHLLEFESSPTAIEIIGFWNHNDLSNCNS